MLINIFSCICMLKWTSIHFFLDPTKNIKTFIPFKIRKKDWAKWARILKNTLTDKHLRSLTCFLVFVCSDKYQNIYSFFRFEIRKKNWAKWAKWARILKSTLTNEQLHSGTCFLVFACSNKHQFTSLLILLEIIENRKKFNSDFS